MSSDGGGESVTDDVAAPGAGAALRIKNLYVFLAINWLSACLLFLLLTLSTTLFFHFRDSRRVLWWFNPAALAPMSGPDVDELFETFYRVERNQYQYQPWVGFSEKVFHSRLVNIDDSSPLPIRRSAALRREPTPRTRKVIWLFGGSTTFGLGVADEETIASRLAAILAQRMPGVEFEVVNHAHCDFYSSQELLLFEWLLRSGHHADVAVFIDGLNETSTMSQRDVPAFADLERQMFGLADRPVAFSPWFGPIRFVRSVKTRLRPQQSPLISAFDTARIVETYTFNVQAARSVAAGQGIDALFFWQPTAFDDIQVPTGPIPLREIGRSGKARPSQKQVADLVPIRYKAPEFKKLNDAIQSREKGLGITSLSALFEGRDFKDIYVDSVHYGNEGCRMIAEKIADRIVQTHLR